MTSRFYGRHMAKPSRSIQAGADLPRSFAVIESDSYRHAVQDMRDAFADSRIHLVIWNKAADLVSDEMKRGIESLRALKVHIERINQLQKPDNLLDRILHHNDSPEGRLIRHFNSVARRTSMNLDRFKAWQDDSKSFMTALQTELNPAVLRKMLRARPINKSSRIHYDGVHKPDNLIVLRNLSGDPTEYYDPADYIGERVVRVGKRGAEKRHFVKEDATRWMAGSLAVAFHSGKILHAAPSIQNEPMSEGQFRINEFFLLKGGREILACHNAS